MKFNNLVSEVLQLQKSYSPRQSEEMKRRRVLVKELEQILTYDLGYHADLLYLKVEGSSGKGNNSLIPWVRIFDPSASASATMGWYLVILFQANGGTAYLSLNQGTNDVIDGGELKRIDESVIVSKSRQARKYLSNLNLLPTGTLETVNLHAPKSQRDLGRGYEYGNVYAFELDLQHSSFESNFIDQIRILEQCRKALTTSEVAKKFSHQPYREVSIAKNDTKAVQIIIKDPGKLERALRGHAHTQNCVSDLIRKFGLDSFSPKGAPDYDVAFKTVDTFFVIEIKSLPEGAEISQLRIGIGQVLHYRAELRNAKACQEVRAILALERKPELLSTWIAVCNDCNITLTYGPDFFALQELIKNLRPGTKSN